MYFTNLKYISKFASVRFFSCNKKMLFPLFCNMQTSLSNKLLQKQTLHNYSATKKHIIFLRRDNNFPRIIVHHDHQTVSPLSLFARGNFSCKKKMNDN